MIFSRIFVFPGFEPMTFWLMPSFIDITFLAGIWISQIDHLALIGNQSLGDWVDVPITDQMVTYNIIQ